MKRLKTIKETKNTYKNFAEYISKAIDLLKRTVEINYAVYFLGYKRGYNYFLNNNTVYVVNLDYQIDNNSKIIIETTTIKSLYAVKLLANYPEKESDIEFKTIIEDEERYTVEKFLNWVYSICDITVEINFPFWKVIIDILNGYTKETFQTKHYIFYSKRDDDYSGIMNFYVFDKKTHAEMKLYIDDCWDENRNKQVPPRNMNDITLEVLSGNVSPYQKRKCKLEFLKYCQKSSHNYWLMELVKLTVQPIEKDCGWAIHRIFSRNDIPFDNIWVDDFPEKNEEPYFFITDNAYSWKTTKVAVLNFKSAIYHSVEIYQQGRIKFLKWELDKDYLKTLVDFLKSPAILSETERKYYGDWVNTNWQKLIFEYNHNTAGWENKNLPPEKDSDRLADVEALPFDLPIPDYTKIEYPKTFSSREWNARQCTLFDNFKQYLKSLNLIGQPIKRVMIVGNIFNDVDTFYDFINGDWYEYDDNNELAKVDKEEKRRIEQGSLLKPWQVEKTFLQLDEPIVLYIGDKQIEIEYCESGNAKIGVNTLNQGNAISFFDEYPYWKDVSKHFSKNIIGHKIVDFEIEPYVFQDDIEGSEYGIVTVDRKKGDVSFGEFSFILDNGYKLSFDVVYGDYMGVWEEKQNEKTFESR